MVSMFSRNGRSPDAPIPPVAPVTTNAEVVHIINDVKSATQVVEMDGPWCMIIIIED